MKAKHRHELKTNELAEWLNNFPKWAKENATQITLVIVGVVVIGVAVLYYWYGKNVEAVRQELWFTDLLGQLASTSEQIGRAQEAGIDTSHNLLVLANDFRSFAEKADKADMAALALIKQAQALRMEVHYRPEAAGEKEFVSQIEQARAAYSEAIMRARNNPSLRATAKLGVGLCEEELGNFDRAVEIYREITETADFEPTVAFFQARQRLATIEDYKQDVVFVEPAPKPPASEAAGEGPVEVNIAPAEPIVQIPIDSNSAVRTQDKAAPNSVPSE